MQKEKAGSVQSRQVKKSQPFTKKNVHIESPTYTVSRRSGYDNLKLIFSHIFLINFIFRQLGDEIKYLFPFATLKGCPWMSSDVPHKVSSGSIFIETANSRCGFLLAINVKISWMWTELSLPVNTKTAQSSCCRRDRGYAYRQKRRSMQG